MTSAITPSREEFIALAQTYTVVPVWTQILADLETPVAAFVKLVGEGNGFLIGAVNFNLSFFLGGPRSSFTAARLGAALLFFVTASLLDDGLSSNLFLVLNIRSTLR